MFDLALSGRFRTKLLCLPVAGISMMMVLIVRQQCTRQLRHQVTSRLGISAKQTMEIPEVNGNNIDGSVATTKESVAVLPRITLSTDVKSGSEEQVTNGGKNVGGQEGEMEEVDLLEECDMLEQENVRLRRRLEKAELALMQNNHDKENPDARENPRVIQVTCDVYDSGHRMGSGSAAALSFVRD